MRTTTALCPCEPFWFRISKRVWHRKNLIIRRPIGTIILLRASFKTQIVSRIKEEYDENKLISSNPPPILKGIWVPKLARGTLVQGTRRPKDLAHRSPWVPKVARGALHTVDAQLTRTVHFRLKPLIHISADVIYRKNTVKASLIVQKPDEIWGLNFHSYLN